MKKPDLVSLIETAKQKIKELIFLLIMIVILMVSSGCESIENYLEKAIDNLDPETLNLLIQKALQKASKASNSGETLKMVFDFVGASLKRELTLNERRYIEDYLHIVSNDDRKTLCLAT